MRQWLPEALQGQFVPTGVALLLFALGFTPAVLKEWGLAVPDWVVIPSWIASLVAGLALIAYGTRWRDLGARSYIVRAPDGRSETWTKVRLDDLDQDDKGALFSQHHELSEWYARGSWKELDRYNGRRRFLLVRLYRRVFPNHRRRPKANKDARDGDIGFWFGGIAIGVRQSGGVLIVFTRLTLSSGLQRDCSLRLSLWMQKLNGERAGPKYVTAVPSDVIARIRSTVTDRYADNEANELPVTIDLGAYKPKRKASEESKSMAGGYAGFFLTDKDLRLFGRWHATPPALTQGPHLLIATDRKTGSIVGKCELMEEWWWIPPVISL